MYHFTVSSAVYKYSSYSPSSKCLIFLVCFSCSGWSEMISSCGCNLHFSLMPKDIEHPFMCLLAVYLFRWIICSSLLFLLGYSLLLLICRSSVYIMDIVCCQIYVLWIFFPVCDLPINYLNGLCSGFMKEKDYVNFLDMSVNLSGKNLVSLWVNREVPWKV